MLWWVVVVCLAAEVTCSGEVGGSLSASIGGAVAVAAGKFLFNCVRGKYGV